MRMKVLHTTVSAIALITALPLSAATLSGAFTNSSGLHGINLPNDGQNHPPSLGTLPPSNSGDLVFTQPTATSTPSNLTLPFYDAPTITSIRGRIVKVRVPSGFDHVSIERKTIRRSQPWAPLANQGCDNLAGGEVTFRLRTPFPKRLLRVVGHKVGAPDTVGATIKLTKFLADPNAASAPQAQLGGGGTVNLGAGLVSDSAVGNSISLGSGTSTAVATRDVVESDVWKLNGDRLYVFNPYRGLQVIDVTDPAKPALAGSLYMPQAGQELYLLDDNHVVLLTQNPLNFTWNAAPITTQQSGVVVCDVSTGKPQISASLLVDGDLLESRLVGTALYVAARVYSEGNWYGRPEIQVTGFDLSDPAQPVKRNTVIISEQDTNSYSYFGALQASDHFFLVGENVWTYDPATSTSDYRTQLNVIDISSPDGTVALTSQVRVDGTVADKFKMREHGGTLSVVSDHWGWWSGTGARHSHLENFSLADPAHPQSLGELDLGSNESLFATRFDGDRVYVVTFRQVDPLWIVDNSDPKTPKISGHVQVPGYSTYIEPLGDRLVTIGYANSKISVSLFDVADATAPKLIQQLPVSKNWAWSEATWNEKAFTVLPEEGLIMVPLTESWYWNWDDQTTTAPENGIQLVDFDRDSLTLRGRIPQAFAPRRSAVHRDAVLALGDSSLLTADIADRDQPAIVSDLSLAWRTDYVWRAGQYLVELGGNLRGDGNVLTVAPLDQPDETLSTLALGNDPVLGADYRDGYVYVLQRANPSWVKDGDSYQYVTPPAHLGIYNADSVPALAKTGETEITDGDNFLSYAPKFYWPNPGTLVLSSEGYYRYPFFRGPLYLGGGVITLGRADSVPIVNLGTAGSGLTLVGGANLGTPITTDAVNDTGRTIIGRSTTTQSATLTLAASNNIAIGDSYFWWPYWGQTDTKTFLALDVTDPKSPQFLGTTKVKAKTSASFSSVFTANGKLFFTHQHSWPWYGYILFADGNGAADGDSDATDADLKTLCGRHFLDVVDFSTPTAPVVREPVSAPGQLGGVAHDGGLLYTVGPDYATDGKPKRETNVVHASVYDGTTVGLLSTLDTGSYWPSVLTMEDRLFVFSIKPSAANHDNLANFTSLYEFGSGSQFRLLDEIIQTSGSPTVLGQTLLSQGYVGPGYAIQALDFSNPTSLTLRGTLSTGWVYPNLSRAIGNALDGFWFPLGTYGVFHAALPK